MHSVERTRAIRALMRGALAALAITILGSCADGFSPLSTATAPQELTATAVRRDAVRLSWVPGAEASVVSFAIERRVDFTGPFIEVAQVPRSTLAVETWLDTDVEPETYYGYRVIAVTGVGDRSAASVISGARTPSMPGIDVVTRSSVTAAGAIDPDGYEVIIAGPDTIRATVGVETRRRFSPLRAGRYSVTLAGLVSRCAVTGGATQTIDVTDTSAVTITPVSYAVVCKDPTRGEIAVTVDVTGDDLDDAFALDILGQAADSTLPTTERVYSARRAVQRVTPLTVLSNIRPGTYDIRIDSIASNCTLQGAATRTASVTPLTTASITFAITCRGSTPPPSTLPFAWRNRWSPKTAAPGATVDLDVSLDLTAKSTQAVQGVQAELLYDPAVLRYEDFTPAQLARLTVNGGNPGAISYVATASGAARTGVVGIAKFKFTVIGAAGARASTRTLNVKAGSPAAFQDSVRVVEDTLTVGTGGAVTNQPPVAQFSGPVTGTTGTALTFTGAASSDPDGTIATYAWTFGDNTTAAVVAPTKTYTAAGTYTVTLTVTDNRGAMATRTASITITAPGTPPPAGSAPVARANGPYTAVAGTPITLSSAGSANAATYSWALGNGQTATGASPTVTYAAAGTYNITLTVTAANGTTATAQATATITAASPPANARPLVWRNVVQAFDAANNSVAIQIVYDLNANISETPGPEALRSFVLDSLKWDTNRLQFLSLNYGPGMVDVATNQPGASSGRLVLRGSTTP
ncbi:MAG TPA: PKD domain-containing protein, partial [Gemmatimonadaceae bacterium]|nr:PKD domain-containing protein [Gemmatimonadaceae bacterium]